MRTKKTLFCSNQLKQSNMMKQQAQVFACSFQQFAYLGEKYYTTKKKI